MKNKPLENRFFYSQFYEQHDKGEKIQILEEVSRKLHDVVHTDESDGNDSNFKCNPQSEAPIHLL